MLLLSRYLLRKFYTTLFFTLLTSVVIFITVDLMENLNKFLDAKIPTPLLISYYELFIPQIIYLVMPVALLLTLVMVLGNMSRHQELTAIKSAGISMWKLMRLLLLQGLLISFFVLYLGETLVTHANRERLAIHREYVQKARKRIKDHLGRVYIQNGTRGILHMAGYDLNRRVGHRVYYEEIAHRKLTLRVEAARLEWNPPEGWRFLNGRIRTFPGDSIITHHFTVLDTLSLEFSPRELAASRMDPMEMNYRELAEFIQRLRLSGAETRKWEVDLHSKLSAPFISAILVLFALPLTTSRRKGVTAIGFGLALLISFLFYGSILLSKNLGYHGTVFPWGAAWFPQLIFIILGLLVSGKVRQ
jgi:lipopolysaccharide export system permease protein